MTRSSKMLPFKSLKLEKGEVFQKRCRRCGVIQPVTAFRVDSRSHDGRRSTCKFCTEDQRVPINGDCSICGNHSDDLVMDHDHDTDMYRDFLCRPCNAGLGFFKDNPNIMELAAEYVKQHRDAPSGFLYWEAKKKLAPLIHPV